jgi:hypothetical protein
MGKRGNPHLKKGSWTAKIFAKLGGLSKGKGK